MKLVGEAWESYRRGVVPGNAPTVQIKETRRAFYAGAAGLLEIVLTCLSPGEEPTDADLKLMDSIKAELDEFVASVVKRRSIN